MKLIVLFPKVILLSKKSVKKKKKLRYSYNIFDESQSSKETKSTPETKRENIRDSNAINAKCGKSMDFK